MNLASIQKITKLTPIEGADKIETASILGWEVVVKKGEFKEGDLVIYIQIDTVVPDKHEFEFLRERKFRVKTIKLKKQLSQGIVFPLSILPNKSVDANLGVGLEGLDVTDLIGVKKYEKPDNNPNNYERPRTPKTWWKKWIYLFKYSVLYKMFPFLQNKLRSPFPKHLVPITDEERIQNIPRVLEDYKGKEFILSYKLDGSSITIIHNRVFGKSRFRICSRRFELHDKKNDWYKVFTSTNFKDEILKLVKHFGTNDIIVQGEAIGKFNGNHHNLQNEQIRLFNIFVDGKKLDQKTFINTCLANNIPHCPLYKVVIMNHTLAEVLKMSEIKDVINPKVEAEGLVWRCVENPTVSFKAINNKFLLKNNE